jgi:hypothetical protein
MRNGHIEDVVFLVVKEWEPIEPNHPIGDTATTESIANGFGHTNHNLSRKVSNSIFTSVDSAHTMVGKM